MWAAGLTFAALTINLVIYNLGIVENWFDMFTLANL